MNFPASTWTRQPFVLGGPLQLKQKTKTNNTCMHALGSREMMQQTLLLGKLWKIISDINHILKIIAIESETFKGIMMNRIVSFDVTHIYLEQL